MIATAVGILRAAKRRSLPLLFPLLGFLAIGLVWVSGAIIVSIATSVPLDRF